MGRGWPPVSQVNLILFTCCEFPVCLQLPINSKTINETSKANYSLPLPL